jgi:hypothetical protein
MTIGKATVAATPASGRHPYSAADRIERPLYDIRDLARALFIIGGTLEDDDERSAVQRLSALIEERFDEIEEDRNALRHSLWPDYIKRSNAD